MTEPRNSPYNPVGPDRRRGRPRQAADNRSPRARGGYERLDTSSFGLLLRRYRNAAGLTQEDLAERARLSARAIADLERGARRVPHRSTIAQLADALPLSNEERRGFYAAGGVRETDPFYLASTEGSWAAPSPFVGRVRERALLRDHLLGAGPPLFLLAGEPGIGKSRLMREVAAEVAARGIRVLHGGGQGRGMQGPYAPLIDALEAYLYRTGPAQRRRDLAGCVWLTRLMPELAEDLDEAPPDWRLSSGQKRRLVFRAIARYLSNIRGPAGLALLLDDVQWAGPDALDLLVFLTRQALAQPLRIIGTYCDQEIRACDPLPSVLADLARAGLVTHHSLEPLSMPEAASLLDQLLADVPDAGRAVKDRMLQRADGIPFFLISCARAWRSGAVDARADGSIPWDVTQSIRQRVAPLAEPVQEILGMAAVVGRVIPRALLVQMSRFPEDEVLRSLELACHAHLLEERGDSYHFGHDIIREVIEADLSEARRDLWHQRAAEALERGPGRPGLLALAYHYTQRGEQDKAITYLEQAGDSARAAHAQATAEWHYAAVVQRLDALGRFAESAAVREKRGSVLITLARYDDALMVLDAAAEVYGKGDNREALWRTMAQIGRAHAGRGTPEDGIARLEELLREAGDGAASHGLAALYAALAGLYWGRGHYVAQLRAAERASDLARSAGDARVLAEAERLRGRAHISLGRVERGLQILKATQALAASTGDLSGLATILHTLSWIHCDRGEFDLSGLYDDQALAIAEQLGDPAQIAFMTNKCAVRAFFAGEWDQTRLYAERALAIYRDLGPSWGGVWPLFDLGRLCLAEGNWTDAMRYLEQSYALAVRSGDLLAKRVVQSRLAEGDLLRGDARSALERLAPLADQPGLQEYAVTAFVLPILAWALLDLGDDVAAERAADQAIARARSAGCRVALSDALRVQAQLMIRLRRWEPCARSLAEGLALVEAMPYPYGQARLLRVHGLLLAERGEMDAARGRLTAALDIFKRLGSHQEGAWAAQALAQLGQEAGGQGGHQRVTDAQWSRIQPLLPRPSRRGRPRVDDRRALDAILYVQRTGSAWTRVPDHLGAGVTAFRRLREWRAAGIWEQMCRIVEAGPHGPDMPGD